MREARSARRWKEPGACRPQLRSSARQGRAVNPVLIYFGAIVVLTAILLAAMMLQIRPTRPCPQCASRVELSKRRCTNCGYEFAPIRLGR
jgi:hypothetical protein